MKSQNIPITFADLTYTKQGIASHSFPLGISLVASYAKQKTDICAELFKYPKDFARHLEKETPKVACFSSYAWNNNLAYGFAKKIKEKNSNTIIIFGGPNYPISEKEQEKYLLSYPAIDFYVRGEGEKAFSELCSILEQNDFNAEKLKERGILIPNTQYIRNNEMITGNMLPRMENLDGIISPYLLGMHDKFFDGVLSPLIQTARGCPFTCAYCQDGNEYFSKITRFSAQRIKKELEYIAERANSPHILIVDDNFGMYKEDIETAKMLADLRRRFDWPKYIEIATGKKNPERVLECAEIVGGNITLSASVQSTNPDVLCNINRNNISFENMIKITKGSERLGASSLGEVILALPGDSKEAHMRSNADLIDLDVNQIRNYQLILLPGSELSSEKNRLKFGMQTGFRVLPRCFGNYNLYGEKFTSFELDEICTSNATLSHKDYLQCRAFDLTIEIAYNSGIFRELINFLRLKNVKPSEFVIKMSRPLPEKMPEIYKRFMDETEKSTWRNKSELEQFLSKPENIAKGDSKEEFRINEIYSARARVFFKKMKQLHEIVFEEARNLAPNLNSSEKKYLEELYQLSLARKNNILENIVQKRVFHFDFIALDKNNFNENPFNFANHSGIEIEIAHTDEQKKMIAKYLEQYGDSIDGLGRILHRNFVNTFYRILKKAE